MRGGCVWLGVGNDGGRGFAVFYPGFEGREGVELVGAGAAAAMVHAGDEEQAGAGGRGFAVQLRQLAVEGDGLRRWDRGVAGTVVDDQLAALGDKALEAGGVACLSLGIGCVHHGQHFVADGVGARVNVELRHVGIGTKAEIAR